MPSNSYGATDEQQEIFDYEPYGMVITAPAGCGKTEALAYRAKGLLERYDFSGNGRRLLIVSFTNQARDNISERLRKYIDTKTLREHVTVCNFHGLAARIIKAHGGVVGIDKTWEVAGFDWVRRNAQTLNCNKETREQVEAALKSAKLTHLSDDEVMRSLQEQAKNGAVGQLAVAMESKRVEARVVTYDDQIRTALWVLQDDKVARLYQNHFFAALVDEFQDLTPQQLRLVKALCGDNITFAGDLAQSIFSFAGADPDYTYQEISNSTNKQIKLLKSFRSAPAVLNAVNSLSQMTHSEQLVAAFPNHWGNSGLSAFASFDNERTEASWIVKMAQRILQLCPNQRVGVITRVGFRIKGVKDTLAANGIQYTDWSSGIFRPEIARALRHTCDDLLSRATEGISFKSKLDIYRYIVERTTLLQSGTHAELEDACSWLFDQVLERDANLSRASEIRESICEMRGDESFATRKGIHCLTGHTGKGQQFDWVFIVGLDKGSIPFYKASTDQEIGEEARVLSVMISRARIGFVTTSTEINAYGYSREPSSFLSLLQSAPGFICGSDCIVDWCAKADWQGISKI
ncbi:UvrD-helicase domain-containing protein [Olsenella profusa]|uniref:DNA 3'-5' helicase n=1 Tax=Olsenella profusa F0195 TaxID=1125712 RepID=U2V086_9ACTN|nr:ATP-dependent helicase [Olsenella profusa]ERL06101.1 AAA protein [Olsenella profusa F0195]